MIRRICDKGLISAFVYALCSVCLLLFNKQIISVYRFPAQRLLIACHTALSALLLWVLRCCGVVQFPPPSVALFRQIGGLGVLNAANVMCSMAALEAVNIPMFTTLRRLSCIFVLIVDALFGGKPPNCNIVVSVVIMITGGVLGGIGDITFDAIGYAYVFANNAVTALYLVLLNRADKAGGIQLNSEGSTFYVSLCSMPVLLTYALVTGEFGAAVEFPRMHDPWFLTALFISMVMAFGLHYSTTLCTQYNSALSTSVTGQIKNVASTGAGLIFFTITPTVELVCGLIVGLIGSGMYATIKLFEKAAKPATSTLPVGGSRSNGGGAGEARSGLLTASGDDSASAIALDVRGTGDDHSPKALPRLELPSLYASTPPSQSPLATTANANTNGFHAVGPAVALPTPLVSAAATTTTVIPATASNAMTKKKKKGSAAGGDSGGAATDVPARLSVLPANSSSSVFAAAISSPTHHTIITAATTAAPKPRGRSVGLSGHNQRRVGPPTPKLRGSGGGAGGDHKQQQQQQVVVIQVGRCGCICQYLLVILMILVASLIAKVKIDPDDNWGPRAANATNTLEMYITDSQRPGLQFAKDGYEPHFPVVFVPGIISTALEVWQGEPCGRRNFRERIWGSTVMIKSIVFDSRCWLRHMMLNHTTGLDPAGIKLRPSTGLEAADFLVGGYWVWAKIIENLADIGYDPNSMFMAPYDWRLAFPDLERRDAYYSRLKSLIEIAQKLNENRKVVITTHSMGGLVFHYFMKWVESPAGGNGGSHWCDDHIHAVVNIGAPFLGVPKSISALFSGEMRDTAELAPFINFLRNQLIFSNSDVVSMMRSFRSVPSMIPKGGTRIWGTADSAPDDIDELTVVEDLTTSAAGDVVAVPRSTLASEPNPVVEAAQPSKGAVFSFTDAWNEPVRFDPNTETGRRRQHKRKHHSGDAAPAEDRASIKAAILDALKHEPSAADVERVLRDEHARYDSEPAHPPAVNRRGADHATPQQFNIDETLDLLRTIAPDYMREIDNLYSTGFATGDILHTARYQESKYWANPLESTLPDARHMKVYCLYGVGKESERSYSYTNSTLLGVDPLTAVELPFSLNTSVNVATARISHGVGLTNGDATVPLVSLGYMCAKGWKHSRFNPSNASVITREYFDDAAQIGLTTQHGGINFMRRVTSSDHVDIMGNSDLITDLLTIVAVAPKHSKPTSPIEIREHVLAERIISRIRAIAERVIID